MLLLLCIVISVVISSLIFFDSSKSIEYEYYFLLPFCYAASCLLLLKCRKKIFNNFSSILILGLYFAKFVILPLITMLGNYCTYMQNKDAYIYIPYAIFLSAYELMCVMFVLGYMLNFDKSLNKKAIFINSPNRKLYKIDALDVVLCIFVGIIILIIVKNPTLRDNFHLITNMDAQEKTIILRSWRTFGIDSEVPYGIVNTVLMYLFPIIQLMFPLMLIEKIYWKSKAKSCKKFAVSLLIVALSSVIMTHDNVMTILTIVALIALLLKIYRTIDKKIICFIAISGGLLVLLLFFQKVRGSGGMDISQDFMEELSKTFNAYLNGVSNLSVVFLMMKKIAYPLAILENIAHFPIIGRYYDAYASSRIFNSVFWNTLGRTDQLLPSIGQGMIYFGIILAPIIPVLFVVLALKLEAWANSQSNIKLKGILLFFSIRICFLIGNNFSHFLGFISSYFLVIVLINLKNIKVVVHK